jgi:hypothetical protein
MLLRTLFIYRNIPYIVYIGLPIIPMGEVVWGNVRRLKNWILHSLWNSNWSMHRLCDGWRRKMKEQQTVWMGRRNCVRDTVKNNGPGSCVRLDFSVTIKLRAYRIHLVPSGLKGRLCEPSRFTCNSGTMITRVQTSASAVPNLCSAGRTHPRLPPLNLVMTVFPSKTQKKYG